MFREKKPGRMVVCSNCSRSTAEGTTQVHRKIVFHFCAVCWAQCRADCLAWMRKVAAPQPQRTAA